MRTLAGVTTLLAVFLIAPGTALAADATLSVESVESDTALLRLAVAGISSAEAMDPASVQVSLDGQPASAEVQGAGVTAPARNVVLLLDVSGSMRGERMESARQAARAFVDEVPPTVAVGLTTFSSEVQVAAAPTTDRGRIRSSLVAARANGRTRLYDGLIAAAAQVQPGDVVLLLSDGADDGSIKPQSAAVQALSASGAGLTAVDLLADGSLRAVLEQLAEPAGGRVVPAAGPGGAASVLSGEADRLRSELQITVALPPQLAGTSVTAEVVAVLGAELVTTQASFAVPGIAIVAAAPPELVRWPAPAPAESPLRNHALRWALSVLFLSISLALCIAFGSVGGVRRDERRMVQLLSRYTVRRPEAPQAGTSMADKSVVARMALGGVANALAREGRQERLTALLQASGSSMQPEKWVLVRVSAVILGAVVMGLLTGLAGMAVGLVAGFFLPQVWLRRRAAKRRTAFGDCLPDALALIVGGLASGYSFAQALDTVVRDGVEPMAEEVGRALAESRLGVPLEQALESVADRMESEDLRWVVMAVGVQREVGGSLAEVLQTVFETMRERARIKRQVRTLSAEGRVSAALLVGLPIFMGLYQFLFRRDYMRPMYTEPVGLVMLAAVAVALVLGGLWTKALVKVAV